MTHPDSSSPRLAEQVEVSRPQLAGLLAAALRTTPLVEQAVAAVRASCFADVRRCDQLTQLSMVWRVALRRAESEATERLGLGLSPGAAHRVDLDDGRCVVIVHGNGWSLVGVTPAVLVFLLDVAPGVVIDRSEADGAAELVGGLAQLVRYPG